MAIKVKHEGSVASRMAASASGGRAKRAMEAAALAKPSQIQTLAPAHASAPGVSMPHAQLVSAPGGGAHAQLIGGGGGIGARFGGGIGSRGGASAAQPSGSGSLSVRRGSGAAGDGDYKVTGTSIFNRPDDESVWRNDLNQWIRPWLPGEKEAEAIRRTGEVQNDLAAERELTTQGRREREALVNDVIAGVKAGRFSPEELPKLMEQFGIAEDTIRMADALREHQPTPEEDFRRNTYTDQNGVVFDRTGKVLYNPQDIQMRQSEAEAKRLDALKARADKFEAELRKPYRTSQTVKGVDGSEEIKDSYAMRTEEEIEAIMRQRFPELYPSAANAPQSPVDPYYTQKFMEMDDKFFPKPTAPQTPSAANAPRSQDVTGAGQKPRADMPAVAKTPEDAKKKWGVKK